MYTLGNEQAEPAAGRCKMSDSFEQQPFGDLGFAENPENRCPVVLILDNSGSMSGAPIQQLNEGLQLFREELVADSLAAKRVEVAIVTFGPVNVLTEFTTVQNFYAPTISVASDTPIGAAIERGISLLADRKTAYRTNRIGYYRPWIFLITDGSPTDSVTRAAQLVREGESSKQFMFFAVGVEGANFEILRTIAVREPLKLKGLAFRELFQWLSSSLSSVSRSRPDDEVPLASPSGWATAG
jgi:uncharacterized protein YegL